MLMKTDSGIQPLCDECRAPMTETGLEDPSTAMRSVGYVCGNLGCQARAFSIDRGYYNIVGGRILADKSGSRLCSSCRSGANMYLSVYSSTAHEGLWRCSQRGCAHEELIVE
jgi:hypothetical protein